DQMLGDIRERARAEQFDGFLFEINRDGRLARLHVVTAKRRQKLLRHIRRWRANANSEAFQGVAEGQRPQKRIVEPRLPIRRDTGSIEYAGKKTDIAEPERPIFEARLLDRVDDDRDRLGFRDFPRLIGKPFDARLTKLARMGGGRALRLKAEC